MVAHVWRRPAEVFNSYLYDMRETLSLRVSHSPAWAKFCVCWLCVLMEIGNRTGKSHSHEFSAKHFQSDELYQLLYFCKHNIKGTLWSLERYISVMCQVSKNCWYCLEWLQWFIKMTKLVILSMIYESFKTRSELIQRTWPICIVSFELFWSFKRIIHRKTKLLLSFTLSHVIWHFSENKNGNF